MAKVDYVELSAELSHSLKNNNSGIAQSLIIIHSLKSINYIKLGLNNYWYIIILHSVDSVQKNE